MSSSLEFDVYVVDVCGTLVREDTTLGLLRYHFARCSGRRWRQYVFGAMTASRSPVRLCVAVLERLTGRHLLKHAVVGLLAGDRKEALAQSASDYAAALLSQGRVSSVWPLIEHPARAGRVVLASASLEPVVASLAASIGARYVASQLEERDGLLTGKYAQDLTGAKEQALRSKYGPAVLAGRVCAISDNFSDRALLEGAEQAYVVLHLASHRQRWNGIMATFLRVDE